MDHRPLRQIRRHGHILLPGTLRIGSVWGRAQPLGRLNCHGQVNCLQFDPKKMHRAVKSSPKLVGKLNITDLSKTCFCAISFQSLFPLVFCTLLNELSNFQGLVFSQTWGKGSGGSAHRERHNLLQWMSHLRAGNVPTPFCQLHTSLLRCEGPRLPERRGQVSRFV